MWFVCGIAELDLAAAVQEDAEDDAGAVRRDLGCDLMPGLAAGSGDGRNGWRDHAGAPGWLVAVALSHAKCAASRS
jgi:hypothetical protein